MEESKGSSPSGTKTGMNSPDGKDYGTAGNSAPQTMSSGNTGKGESTEAWGGPVRDVYGRGFLQTDKVLTKDEEAKRLLDFQRIPSDCYVAQIGFTSLNTILLTTTGKVYTWGGVTCCLGRSLLNKEDSKYASAVTTLKEIVVQVACGTDHVLALDAKGRVYAWGKNDYGQMGTSKPESILPIEIRELREICQIYAGENSSIAVRKDGKVYVWGDNKNNKLGLDEKWATHKTITTPTSLEALPWQEREDTNVAFGPKNQMVFYTGQKPYKRVLSTAEKDLNKATKEIFELKKKISRIEQRNHDLEQQLLKDSDQQISSAFDQDKLVKQIDRLKEKSIDDLARLIEEEANMKKELDLLDAEVHSFNQELANHTERETKLKKDLEAKKMLEAKHGDKYTQERKVVEQLVLSANGLKSTYHQKMTELRQDQLNLKKKVKEIESKKKELQDYNQTLDSISKERKKTLVKIYLANNDTDFEQLISGIHQLFENLKKTEVKQLSASNVENKGMKDILQISRDSISKIEKDAVELNVEMEDPRFEIFSKVFAIFNDNVALRREINNYIEGLLEQTEQKLERFYRMRPDLVANNPLKFKAAMDRIGSRKGKRVEDPDPIANSGRRAKPMNDFSEDGLFTKDTQKSKRKERCC